LIKVYKILDNSIKSI